MRDGYDESEVENIDLHISNRDAWEEHLARHSNLRPTKPLILTISPTYWAADRRRVPWQFRIREEGIKDGHIWVAGGGEDRDHILRKLLVIGLTPW